MACFGYLRFFAVNQRKETAMQSIKDTYLRITDAIIEQLEAGAKPWIRPVFNIEQIENLPDRFYRPAEELPATPVPHLETPARRSPTAEQPPAVVPPPTTSSRPIGYASSTRFTSTRPCFTKCRTGQAQSIASTVT